MKTVMQEQDSRPGGLPLRVREALGELAGAAQEGLLALSVGVGLGVLAELLEEEVVLVRLVGWLGGRLAIGRLVGGARGGARHVEIQLAVRDRAAHVAAWRRGGHRHAEQTRRAEECIHSEVTGCRRC